MSEDKHHGAIKEAITDFEREARALDEHMGLDAQNSKVQEFVHGLNEFSPWIREELLKVSKLEAKKRGGKGIERFGVYYEFFLHHYLSSRKGNGQTSS